MMWQSQLTTPNLNDWQLLGSIVNLELLSQIIWLLLSGRMRHIFHSQNIGADVIIPYSKKNNPYVYLYNI